MDRLAEALRLLKFRHLRVIEAVNASGSISEAARTLNVSQPAVSKTVLEAERILGVPIFERGAHGVALTAYGRILLVRGRIIQAEIRNITSEIAAWEAGSVGTVTIGALLVSLPRLLPDAIARMRARAGDCVLRVVSGTQDSLMGALRAGEVDLIVGRLPPHGERDRLIQEILYHEPIVIVARAGHGLFATQAPDIADLARAAWVFPTADSSVFGLIIDFFTRHGLSLPRSHVESVSFELVRTLLLEQDMVAALPRSVVQAELNAGSLRELGVALANAQLPVGVTRRADQPVTPLLQMLLHCLSP
jgi:DNA-binding transcriptional LysR family regulator